MMRRNVAFLLCLAGVVVARKPNNTFPARLNVSRPSFASAPSICKFTRADEYPIRSPMVVADYIISQAVGKSYVEVGTRQGDLFKCVQPYTTHAFAIEMDNNYCHALRRRDIQVLCTTFETVPVKKLLFVQVFFWFVWPPELSEKWIRRLG